MNITLCGSARFETTFREWDEKLTLAGHCVYNLAVYPRDKNGQKDWYEPRQKIVLDSVHMVKILRSDAIVVLNVDDYIGESTAREVMFALINDKAVFWLATPINVWWSSDSVWTPFSDKCDWKDAHRLLER